MVETKPRPRKRRERSIDYPVTPWLDLVQKIEDDCESVIPSLRLRANGLLRIIAVLSRREEFLTVECWCRTADGSELYGWMHFSPRVQYTMEQTMSRLEDRFVGSVLIAGLKNGGRMLLRTHRKGETAEVILGDGCILEWKGKLRIQDEDENIINLLYYSIRGKKIGSLGLPYELH